MIVDRKHDMAVVTAHTSVLMGKFDDFHAYAEQLLGTSIYTHQFANLAVWDKIKEKSKADWDELCTRLTGSEKETIERAAIAGEGDSAFFEMYNNWNK